MACQLSPKIKVELLRRHQPLSLEAVSDLNQGHCGRSSVF